MKQPKQVGGDALAGGGRGRLQDLEHGIHSHAFRCGEREAPALRVIGAGLKQTPECLRSQARHQTGDALAGPRFQGSRAPGDLLGHLPEVVQDHPVVRDLPDLIVDGPRDEERIDSLRRALAVRRQREIREPHPQLIGGPEGRFLRRLVPVLVQEQPAELGCLKLDVLPRRRALELQPQGTRLLAELTAEIAEQPVDLVQARATLEADGGDALPVQTAGEVAEQRVARVGGDPADDELMARDPDREPIAVLEQGLETADEAGGALLEVRVPVGVQGPLVEHDRELDQEVRQVPGQGRHACAGRQGTAGTWDGVVLFRWGITHGSLSWRVDEPFRSKILALLADRVTSSND